MRSREVRVARWSLELRDANLQMKKKKSILVKVTCIKVRNRKAYEHKHFRKKKEISPGWVLLSFLKFNFNFCLVAPRVLPLFVKKCYGSMAYKISD